MKVGLFFALIGAASVLAQEGLRFETFQIRHDWVRFSHTRKPPLLIVANCRQGTDKYECLAFKKYRDLKTRRSEINVIGGQAPGATLCKANGGVTLVGHDKSNNENIFCEFADGSIISAGSLHAKSLLNETQAITSH